MDISKELNGRYLIITQPDLNYHSLEKMIENNMKDVFLPFEARRIDQDVIYRYEITELLSLREYFSSGPFGKKEVEEVFFQIIQILEVMEEYFLNPEDIMLDDDGIFIEPIRKKVKVAVVPNLGNDVKKELATMLEMLMEKMDHKNSQLVMWIYEMYQICREKKSTIVTLKAMISDTKIEETIETREVPEEKVRQNCQSKPMVTQEKSPFFLGVLGMGIGVAVLIIAGKLGCYQSVVSGHLEMVNIFCALIGVVGLEGYFLNRIKFFGRKQQMYGNGKEKEDIVFSDETVILDLEMWGGFSLEPIEGGETIAIAYFPFWIGSQRERVDGVIDAKGVSRMHGRFEREGKQFLYTDQNSQNGSYINEERLVAHQPQFISDGDELQVAATRFRVVQIS